MFEKCWAQGQGCMAGMMGKAFDHDEKIWSGSGRGMAVGRELKIQLMDYDHLPWTITVYHAGQDRHARIDRHCSVLILARL